MTARLLLHKVLLCSKMQEALISIFPITTRAAYLHNVETENTLASYRFCSKCPLLSLWWERSLQCIWRHLFSLTPLPMESKRRCPWRKAKEFSTCSQCSFVVFNFSLTQSFNTHSPLLHIKVTVFSSAVMVMKCPIQPSIRNRNSSYVMYDFLKTRWLFFSSKDSFSTLGLKKNQTEKLSQNLKGFLY